MRTAVTVWLAEPAAKAAVVLTVATAFLITSVAADWRPVLGLDHQVATHLHTLALEHPGWTHATRILTDWVVAPWTMQLTLAAAVIRLWRHRERMLALWTTATSIAEVSVRQVLRWAVGRDRPLWEHPVDSADFAAMPSGHAMTAATTCVLLLWLARRTAPRGALTQVALPMAVLVVAGACFTRVLLGVHWLTDTLAGALLGTALALASIAAWHTTTNASPSAQRS